ncbi:hypothetical protein Gorai_007223 [Gossypium raimondii]|uniref:Ty3 transposon capsid-like protein domain-containing protein n=4 Tax=Gossypium TaxID=3633 RepID=A0A7J8Q7C4_GOSRA|nr:hypothetical protein [Gossypium raimondii]
MEFEDPMAELESLKQTATMDQYNGDFLGILNELQLSDSYAVSVFIENLKPDVAKLLKIFRPKTLTKTLHLAMRTRSVVNAMNSSLNLTAIDERFPFDELLKWKHPGLGNKDVSDTKDDDEDKEDDNADEKDDDGADEDFSGEEGDPEDDPEANGDGGSGEEEDDNERGC